MKWQHFVLADENTKAHLKLYWSRKKKEEEEKEEEEEEDEREDKVGMSPLQVLKTSTFYMVSVVVSFGQVNG